MDRHDAHRAPDAWSEDDRAFMTEALRLAALGSGWVNPNPQVGCVIVREGRIIGSGYHQRFGEPHAERHALGDAHRRGEAVAGSTIYVTLEPCAHQGKTPPCADALVEAAPGRVVIGSVDPHDRVAGRGIAKLRDAGIQVDVGCLEDECHRLNRPFFHHITTGMPWVVAKYAMTLDGKMATRTGASKWITGDAARQRVHVMRSRYAAIMVGIGTALADDPLLTARPDGMDEDEVHQPLRIVCDSELRLPLGSRIAQTAHDHPTMIAATVSDPAAVAPYEEAGVDVLTVPKGTDDLGRRSIDLAALLHHLGEEGIDSVLVEGGPRLLGSLFDGGHVNEVCAFVAPQVFGGASAPSPVGGIGVAEPGDARRLKDVRIEQLGEDVLISGVLHEGGE